MSEKRKAKRMVFTDTNVLSLHARVRAYMVWDGGYGRNSDDVCRGLGILVSPLGAKSYRSMFYLPGSSRSHSRHLGRIGEITLAEARALCRQDRANARRGIDPRQADPMRSSNSYQDAVNDYVERVQIGERKNASAKGARSVMLNDCQDWLERPLAAIQATELQRRLELVRDGNDELKPRPYLANVLHARWKHFFTWCCAPQIGKLTASPMIAIGRPSRDLKRRERDWFAGRAGDEAIKQPWAAADKLGGIEGQYLKVLLLTGKRKTALAGMCWEQIDDSWFWTAPPGRKNKRCHAVPLASLTQRILHPRQPSGYVFPGRDGSRIEVDSNRLSKLVIANGAMDDFFLHGVRHLAETKLAELKVPRHIRDKLFDHVDGRGSSAKHYDHFEYRPELEEAAQKWADHIEQLVMPQGVALLR
jgi:integrase